MKWRKYTATLKSGTTVTIEGKLPAYSKEESEQLAEAFARVSAHFLQSKPERSGNRNTKQS